MYTLQPIAVENLSPLSLPTLDFLLELDRRIVVVVVVAVAVTLYNPPAGTEEYKCESCRRTRPAKTSMSF